jgi:hypothetical protein
VPRYSIDRTDRVYEWAATADPERLDAMLAWLQAVCIDHEMVTTGRVTNVKRTRNFSYADVAGARTRVAFAVIDVPARCIRILNISDALFESDT